MASSITLTIKSSADQVSPLGISIHALCLYATGSETCAYEMQLAAVEAVNNVIKHAYGNQPGNDIIVLWRQDDITLRIEIIDHGLSMLDLPDAKLPQCDAECGRGWWIIRHCVDEYYYKVIEYVEKERVLRPGSAENSISPNATQHSNILTLIKKFPPISPLRSSALLFKQAPR